MAGPFSALSKSARRRALWVLGACELGLLVPLLALERRMKRAGGPGIIPFELAGTPERSAQIKLRWGAEGRTAARLSLLLDYPFLATYSTLHAIACTTAADTMRARGAGALAAVGPVVAWGQLAGGGFDALENTALLAVLSGRDGRLPVLASASAKAKFALLYAGWAYVLLAAAASRRSL